MASNAWKKAKWPGAGKSTKVEPKGEQKGNGVSEYGDMHAAERHQHGPDPVGKGKVIKTED